MGTIESVNKIYDFRFAENTTYRLGGAAKVAYFPENEAEMTSIFEHFSKSEERFVILGKGSNVLASDEFFDGAVISTSKLKGISRVRNELHVMSGTTVAALMNYCINQGVGGLEYLAGIPASLGGLVYMNGGIPSRHIGEDVLFVELFDGKVKKINAQKCQFSNKHSIMCDINCVILKVVLGIYDNSREEIIKKILAVLKNRSGQPKLGNCGCVFKNPPGMSAGQLIDKAGLKGLKRGGARISEKHANFILNDGATANEVYSLISEVKARVFELFGIRLAEEVVYIGEFNDSYS